MYTRSYYPDTGELPENYGGMAMRASEPPPEPREPPSREETTEPAGIFGGTGAESPLKMPIFSSLFSRIGAVARPLGIERVGTEELLIIGVALYLLFSKSGDKECAIILLLLLLVN